MSILGLNDTVVIKTKSHTANGRGGVTTSLTTKISSLTCSIQPIRREELRFLPSGEDVIEPYLLLFDNITSGSDVEQGDIVEHSTGNYLVVSTGTIPGKGTHTEAVLKKISNDSYAE